TRRNGDRPALAGGRRDTARPRARDAGTGDARRRSRRGQRARRDRERPSVGGGRELAARDGAWREGSRRRSRVRRGGAHGGDQGLYGTYGGRYVPETLIPALDELVSAWEALRDDAEFRAEVHELGVSYAGRPTPLTLAERFAPGKRLYLKREDLMHTGAHKLNNALGQSVIPRRLVQERPRRET